MKLCDHAPYIEHLKAEIAWLKNELAVAQGKVDRMECAIMPLTSPAGARYANPPVRTIREAKVEDPFAGMSGWARMQAENELEVGRIEKETHDVRNGVRSKEAKASDVKADEPKPA